MLDNIITIITGPTVEKTKDPLYSKAKLKLKKILSDVEEIEQIIYSIEQMEKALKYLSDASYQLGKDLNESFSDASEEEKLKARTNLNFTKNFYALTNSFLIPRIDEHVILLIRKIKNKANHLLEVKKNVKLLRQEYDLSRAIVHDYYANYSDDEVEMRNAINKMKKDEENYRLLNTKFIDSVNKLKKRRKSTFYIPLKNMLCLTSQYMMQVFTEIQKYRISFPPKLFVKK